MIQKIFISNEENYSDLLQSMDKVRNVLLMQFGIDLDDLIKTLKDEPKHSPKEDIVDKTLIGLRKYCYNIIDSFYFYNPHNSPQNEDTNNSKQIYDNALIKSTYSTLCYLLDSDKLLSLNSIRKSIVKEDNKTAKETNKEKEEYEPVFSSGRTSYHGQRIFNKSYKIKKKDKSLHPYEPDKYLYDMIIPKSEKRKHNSGEPKKLSKFANIASFCILCNFDRIKPERLFMKLIKSNTIDDFCDILKNYTDEYNKIMEIIYQQYIIGKDVCVINDFLVLETIIPIRLIYSTLSFIEEINFLFYYNTTTPTNLVNALTRTIEVPVSYNIMDLYNNSLNGLAENNIYLKYDHINSSIPDDIPVIDQERLNIWSNNLEKSISMFSNITYPLISKAFFTIFKVHFDDNENNIENTLIEVKNKLEKKIAPDITPRKLAYEKAIYRFRLVDSETFRDMKKIVLFILYYTVNLSEKRLYKNIDEHTFSLSRDNSIYLFYGHPKERDFDRDYESRQKTNRSIIKNFIDTANNDYINAFKARTHEDMKDT